MMKISQSGGNNEIHNKPEERCVRRGPWPRDSLINAEVRVCVRCGGTWGVIYEMAIVQGLQSMIIILNNCMEDSFTRRS